LIGKRVNLIVGWCGRFLFFCCPSSILIPDWAIVLAPPYFHCPERKKRMKAYGIAQYGELREVLQVVEVPKPKPGPRDLIVAVSAVATNPVDLKKLSGMYDGATGLSDGKTVPSPPIILGYDASGIVEEVGSEVSLFKPGDEVYFAGTINRNGSFAQYTAVDERIVGRKPASLSHEEAAALPLTSLTAWELLVEDMNIPIPADVGNEGVNLNKTILILGGAGGVGSISIQIAKHVLKIGRVVATASRPETISYCKQLGADEVINHSKPLADELAKVGIKSVDYTFITNVPDPVINSVIELTNPLGRIGMILPLTQQFNTIPLFAKRIALHWELMFTRPVCGVELEKQGAILNRVSQLFEAKVLHTTANTRFPWDKMVDALDLQDSGKAIGKIVLPVSF